MRNVFFALVLVNVAYFGWAHWINVRPPPPVNQAIEKLPRLKLASEQPAAASAGAPPTQNAGATVPAGPSRCMSVGPFPDVDDGAKAAALLKTRGFEPRQRAVPGETSEGYWAYVAGLKSDTDTGRVLRILAQNGIKDAVIMTDTPANARRISLGLFSDRARAQRRVWAARLMGLDAAMEEKKVPGAVYWVDLSLSPDAATVPLEGLFADTAGAKIAVQPCPATEAAQAPASIAAARTPADPASARASGDAGAVPASDAGSAPAQVAATAKP